MNEWCVQFTKHSRRWLSISLPISWFKFNFTMFTQTASNRIENLLFIYDHFFSNPWMMMIIETERGRRWAWRRHSYRFFFSSISQSRHSFKLNSCQYSRLIAIVGCWCDGWLTLHCQWTLFHMWFVFDIYSAFTAIYRVNLHSNAFHWPFAIY